VRHTVTIGVISHIPNPTFEDVRELARAAEAAGADWLGLPDAFWWRDSWLLLAEAARATERIELGPLVTNPYLRHPFHTLAALASLQELAGSRVFVGIGAGGSEVSGAARVSRRDAPERVRGLAGLIRRVAGGEALDARSGRTLEVPLAPLPVVIAGRADGILQAAGRSADRALLWAVPTSELERSAATIAAAAEACREANGPRPELIWAPLVDHAPDSRDRVRTIAAYSVLNSRPAAQAAWGLDRPTLDELRRLLVGGGAAAAQALVPTTALDDLIIPADPRQAGQLARTIGATSVAVPAFSIGEAGERVAWAREVLHEG
jgi:alkanesulfonate monooxygenase SsuD/methylene tetrahydromethanopterin reductase-like flavin-dependent oxidoreductase (luciferase family)